MLPDVVAFPVVYKKVLNMALVPIMVAAVEGVDGYEIEHRPVYQFHRNQAGEG